jgi:hypothetical protein
VLGGINKTVTLSSLPIHIKFKRSKNVKGLSSRSKNVIRAQFKRGGCSTRVAVCVIMTRWERGGRSTNLQGTYKGRKENLVMQKMPILTSSSLRSLKKKFRTQRGLRCLRVV